MVLELAVLHIFNKRKVELGHKVFVHVEKDVADHNDAVLDLLPDTVEFTQELLFVCLPDILRNRLQKLHRCVLNRLVKHLSVLMEDQGVGRTVKFLVTKTTGLLVVDLVDRILDGLPVLLSLRALHVGIAHATAVNQKLVLR